MRLLLASHNAGKAREFSDLLQGAVQFDALGDDEPTVDETALSFSGNAVLKASETARRTRRWTLADDSGLCVDALGGRPGVVSARWAEQHDAGRGAAANVALLLRQLAKVPPEARPARFVCVLALADPLGRIVATTSGELQGTIALAPRGMNGFGYDPIFVPNGDGRTLAEWSAEEKHAVSHRARAVTRLLAMLEQFGTAFAKEAE